MAESVPPPPPAASPNRPVAGRNPGYVPGQKKARHKRWTRITTTVTLAGVAVCAGFAIYVLPRLLDKPTLEESRVAGTREFLAGIAEQVRIFIDARHRMPRTLADLRDQDLPSVYDAEPWDVWRKPIEYRVLDDAKRTFELRSLGPDGKADTPDDVVWPPGASWK